MHSKDLTTDRNHLIEWCLFLLVALASLHCAWAVNGFDPYEFLRRGSDQLGYYQWLPAFFVDQDLGKMYWCHQMENGKWISMFTFGVALLQLPFFFIAQLSAEVFGYDLNGFSPPYAVAQMVGVALYTGAGAVLSYRIARRFSTEESALLAVVALFAATNLFYYSVYAPTMSHSYSFFLVGLFCYSALRFLDGPDNPVRSVHVVLLVLSGSLLVFVRQLNIIVFIFPLLVVYRSAGGFPGFLRTLLAHRTALITTGVLVLVPWIVQCWYWYDVTGDPFTFTYGKKDEHFEFTKMVPGRVLLDVRNGWLIYTPLMIPVLVVLIKHAWRNTAGARAIGLVFLLSWLLYSAWWCWWLGTGYGYRGFVDLYALLVIPLAWVFRSVFSRPIPVRIFAALTMVALIYLNFGLMEKFTWEWSWENWTWQLYFGEVGRIFGGS